VRILGSVSATTSPAKPRGSAPGPAAWLLSVGHAVDDVYQGAVPALIPFFAAARHWDYLAASGITVAATMLSSVAQPVFGMLTDRCCMPWLVPLGMSVAGAGIGLSGLGRTYALTWLAIALSGLGIAAYHPESARLARRAAGGSHTAMSWFSLGGNVGFATGPLAAGAVLGALGAGGTPVLAIPALACATVTWLALRRARWASHPAAAPGAAVPGAAVLGRADDWAGFAKLTVAVIARSVVTVGLGTFLALFAEHRIGPGTTIGEAALVTFGCAAAAGTLLGGRLATRFGRIRTVRAAYLLSIPALAAVWLTPGPALFAAVTAAGLVLYVPFSLHVTLGQDYLPGRIGTASGLTLGLAVSVGGLASPLLGVIADRAGLGAAIATLTLMPVVSALIGARMREPAADARPSAETPPGAASSPALRHASRTTGEITE
jgi:MFS transporter, FSR family, fosmidomycin resistance protein